MWSRCGPAGSVVLTEGCSGISVAVWPFRGFIVGFFFSGLTQKSAPIRLIHVLRQQVLHLILDSVNSFHSIIVKHDFKSTDHLHV